MCFLIVLWSLCFGGAVYATGQAGEWIIIGNDTLQMLACPLEADSALASRVRERLPKEGINTGLWRGYVGLWRLEEGKLFLEKIEYEDYHEDTGYESRELDLDGIFDAYMEDGRVFARWFSGELRVVDGNMVHYEHMGFARHYECETVYTLRDGRVRRTKETRNALLKGTNERPLESMGFLFDGSEMEWGKDSLIFARVLFRRDGRVRRVKVSQTERDTSGMKWEEYEARKQELEEKGKPERALSRLWEKYWDSKYVETKYGRNHPFTRELEACARLIDWDVLVLDGKPQPMSMMMRWGGDRSRGRFGVFADGREYDLFEVGGVGYRMDAYPLQQASGLIARLRLRLEGACRTECPRGYRAEWRVADGRLWLTGLRNAYTGEEIPLSAVEPGNHGEPIAADWYTGSFRVAWGEDLYDRFRLYGVRKHEKLVEVENGRVVCEENYENRVVPGDKASFSQFERTLRAHAWADCPELKERSLRGEITVYPRVDGRADSIAVNLYVNGEDKVDGRRYHREIKDPADPWIAFVRRAAEKVARWEVRFVRGEVRPLTFWVDIYPAEEKR